MKKIYYVFGLIIGILLFSPKGVWAYTGDFVKTFRSDVTLNQDASIDVVETIDYHFNSYKHGIYREIPVNYRDSMAFTRPTILQLQEIYYYADAYPSDKYNSYENSYDNGYRIFKIGDGDITIIGDYTYVIKYKLIYANNYFADHDELYLNITGTGWEVPIETAVANISVPGTITQKVCYTGSTDSTLSNCTFSNVKEESLTVTASNLNVYEGLTVAISMPKDTIANTTNKQRIEFLIANLGLILPLIAVVLAVLIVKKYNLNKKLTIVPHYNVPKGMNPLKAGYLYKKSLPANIISAQLIQLAVDGYMRIKQLSKRDYEFVKTEKNEPDDEQEKLLYNGIFKTGDVVNLKKLNSSFYTTVSALRVGLEKRLVVEDLFSKEQIKNKNRIVAISAVVLFLSFFTFSIAYNYAVMSWPIGIIVSSIIMIVASSIIDKRSTQGNKLYYDLEGLKMYINTAEERRIEFHNDPKKYTGIFEKLLPYAMIFGLEKKWAKEFEDIYTQQPDWYEGNTNMFNSYLFLNSLNHINRQIVSYSSPQNSSHGFSSSHAGFGGSGFSGGSSGGGFGGGGGGSW